MNFKKKLSLSSFNCSFRCLNCSFKLHLGKCRLKISFIRVLNEISHSLSLKRVYYHCQWTVEHILLLLYLKETSAPIKHSHRKRINSHWKRNEKKFPNTCLTAVELQFFFSRFFLQKMRIINYLVSSKS